MHPSEKDLDQLANRLAKDVSSDEKQLNELGASVFTNAKLLELRGRYLERLEQFDFWQRLLMKAALLSPVLLVAGAGLFWLKAVIPGWMLITAFPVVFAGCLASVFLMYRRFGVRKKVETWLEDIECELEKRQANK
jgi:hypothetical protein